VNRQKVIESVRYIMAGPRWAELQRLDAIADALKPWTPYQAQRQLTSHAGRF
jgi:hypothetical protein